MDQSATGETRLLDREERQRKREEDDRDLGARKYRERANKAPLHAAETVNLLDRAVRALVNKIELEAPKLQTGRTARTVGHVLHSCQPLDLALWTVHVAAYSVIRAREDDEDGEAGLPSLQTVIEDLGRTIVQNMGLRVLQGGEAWRWLFGDKKDVVDWGIRDRRAFALLLLEWLRATGELINITQPDGQHDQLRVSLLPQANEWLASENSKHAFLRPLRNPMVAPPRPWDDTLTGGYLSPRPELRLPLVRIRGPQPPADVVRRNVRSLHVQAINALQTTAWCINSAVLDAAWREYPEMKKPTGRDAKAGRIDWKQMVAEYRRRIFLRQVLEVAEHDRDEPELYFPLRPDHRGRIYPDSDALNLMQGDLSRGLLQFANAEPLGERGRFWLAVHLANCYGRGDECGKLATLEQRAAWTERNGPQLLSLMDHADENLRPKEHWQFYAAAREWQAMLGRVKRGGTAETFMSRIPVMLDGRANGIQHYAALAGSRAEGELVGLVPSDRPRDLYTELARDLAEELARRGFAAQKGVDQHAIINHLATRDFIKGMVQPLIYGSTIYTRIRTPKMLRDFVDALEKKHRLQVKNVASVQRDVQKAFDAVVKAKLSQPFAYQRWFKSGARALWREREAEVKALVNEEAKRQGVAVDVDVFKRFFPLRKEDEKGKQTKEHEALAKIIRKVQNEHLFTLWRSPSGWEVWHQPVGPVDSKTEWFQMKSAPRRSISFSTGWAPERKAFVRAIPPNLIHSLDAAHAALFVLEATARGVHSIALVHDCVGAHGGKVDTLLNCVQKIFAVMYDRRAAADAQFPSGAHEVLDRFEEQCRKKRPAVGDYDPNEVLHSTYFWD